MQESENQLSNQLVYKKAQNFGTVRAANFFEKNLNQTVSIKELAKESGFQRESSTSGVVNLLRNRGWSIHSVRGYGYVCVQVGLPVGAHKRKSIVPKNEDVVVVENGVPTFVPAQQAPIALPAAPVAPVAASAAPIVATPATPVSLAPGDLLEVAYITKLGNVIAESSSGTLYRLTAEAV